MMQKLSPTAHWLTLPAHDAFLLGMRGFEANSKLEHGRQKSGQCLCMYVITLGLVYYRTTFAPLQLNIHTYTCYMVTCVICKPFAGAQAGEGVEAGC